MRSKKSDLDIYRHCIENHDTGILVTLKLR